MFGIRHKDESESGTVELSYRTSFDFLCIVDCVAALNDCVTGFFQSVPEPYPVYVAHDFHIGDGWETESDSASFTPDQFNASP